MVSRWSRRHKRTFGKKKEESKVFLEEHRVPPKPTHYYTQDKVSVDIVDIGFILNVSELNTKKVLALTMCVDESICLSIIPGETRKYIWKRDNGECASIVTNCFLGLVEIQRSGM